jgi:hypothetical protein
MLRIVSQHSSKPIVVGCFETAQPTSIQDFSYSVLELSMQYAK